MFIMAFTDGILSLSLVRTGVTVRTQVAPSLTVPTVEIGITVANIGSKLSGTHPFHVPMAPSADL